MTESVTEAETAEPGARGYRSALLALAVGAGLLLVGFGRTWVTAVVRDTGLPTVVVELTGRDLAPAGAAMAVVALAGLAALVATRRLGRLLTGAVLLVAGLVAAAAAVGWGAVGGEVLPIVAERAGVSVTPAAVTASRTSWWLVALVGGLLVAGAGLGALIGAGRWTTLGGRYERRTTEAPQARAGAPAASAWDQLDAGIDPTVEEHPSPGGALDQDGTAT